MAQTARVQTLYQALEGLPEGVTGELINGQLHAHPRPAARHARVAIALGADLLNAYDRGRGGPGGWWIIGEPEVHFIRNEEVLVPDIAGWRRERMAALPDDQRFTVAPDWACEILSPSTASYDREVKLPLYARYGVRHVWLVEPRERTVEVLALAEGGWRELARFGPDDSIQAPPFEALALSPADLWV
jgi:Uma2 family endonuclease